MSKSTKIVCILGSFLLLAMGLFHGSGLNWISGELADSNAPGFLKDVFPVLFIHVSIQLTGLAALGAALLFMQGGTKAIAWFITAMVLADVGLAIWLQAYPPGIALFLAALCFGWVATKAEVSQTESTAQSA